MATYNEREENRFDYDYDFKEFHNRHIHRPALVTIRKPFLSNAEMTDVLTRLLTQTVVPVSGALSSTSSTTRSSGLGRRAFLVDYRRTYVKDKKNEEKELLVPYGVYEIKQNENIYIQKSNKSINIGDRHDPINIEEFFEKDKSSEFQETFKDTNVVWETTYSSVGKYDVRLAPSAITSASITQERSASAKYTVLLFDDGDNDALLPNKSDGRSTREDIVKNKTTLFTPEGYLTFRKDALVTVWDPKYPNGNRENSVFQFTKETAKKAFGYVPKRIQKAYAWDFTVPGDVQVFIDAEDKNILLDPNDKEQLANYLSARSQELRQLYNTYPKYLKGGNFARNLNALGENLHIDNVRNQAVLSILQEFASTSAYGKYAYTPEYIEYKVGKIASEILAVLKNNAILISTYIALLNRKGKSSFQQAKAQALSTKYLTANIGTLQTTAGLFKAKYYTLLMQKVYKKIQKLVIDGKFNTTGKLESLEDLDDVVYIPTLPIINQIKESYKDYKEWCKDVNEGNFVDEKNLNNVTYPNKYKIMAYIKLCESVLFGETSGIYITSYTTNKERLQTSSPYYNSIPDATQITANSTDIDVTPYSQTLIDCKNTDVSGINVQRVISGMSTATISLKNANQKYNYKRSDQENRGNFLIEPMDEVVIWLPTIEHTKDKNYTGKLKVVFSGVVSSVTDSNVGGYNEIKIKADDFKKFLKVNRTNMTPSTSREESDGEKLTAFTVPMEMFESIENWMPMLFAQALSYIRCLPASIDTIAAFDKPLAEKKSIKQTEKVRFSSLSKIEQSILVDEEVTRYAEMLKEGTKPKFGYEDVADGGSGWHDDGSLIYITKNEWDAQKNPDLQFIVNNFTSDLPVNGDTRTVYTQAYDAVNKLITYSKQEQIYREGNYTINNTYSTKRYGPSKLEYSNTIIPVHDMGLGSEWQLTQHTVDVVTTEMKCNIKKEVKVPGVKIESVVRSSLESKEITVFLGYYKTVNFCDPLYTYLWYKANTKNATNVETNIIEKSQKELLDCYIETDIAPIHAIGERKPHKGVTAIKSVLASGARAAYLVYKQRFSGITMLPNYTISELAESIATNKRVLVNDRRLAAMLCGTSQPVFALQSGQLTIQFSNWKTNNDIINDVAQKFNFCYYTSPDGVVLFTPYNFDLTTLNTSSYNRQSFDTDHMYKTASVRDLEVSDNYGYDNIQILKQQYLTNFIQDENDAILVNWVQASGAFTVAGNTGDMIKAQVKDPVLIKKYGYRAAKQVSVLGIADQQALELYCLSWMDRNNKRYRTAMASGLFDARMDINIPYYVPHYEMIYHAEAMSINYQPGDTCTYNMQLSFGRKPILNLTNKKDTDKQIYDSDYGTINGQELKRQLTELYQTDNAIKPSTFVQYIKDFGLSTPDLVSTSMSPDDMHFAVHCFNGYIWDNVAGITFEELVYNYLWLYSGRELEGFKTALGTYQDEQYKGKFEQAITKYFDTRNKNINMSSQNLNAIAVLGDYTVKVPALTGKSAIHALKKQLAARKAKITNSDLEEVGF